VKLKFKVQPYQTQAVTAVVDCFAGQPMSNGITYRIDPGRKAQTSAFEEGFKNADLALTELQVLANIKDVQRHQNLPVSDKLVSAPAAGSTSTSKWRRGPARPIATSRRSSR
jgi:type III restriction enzyme